MDVLGISRKSLLPALLCAGLVGCTTDNASVTLSNVGTGNGTLASGGAQTGYVLGGVAGTYFVTGFSLSKSGTPATVFSLPLSGYIGPVCIAVDPTNGTLYVGGMDYTNGNNPIPKVWAYPSGSTTASRVIVGNATPSTFDEPIAMTVDSSGSLYIASTPYDSLAQGDAGTITVYSSTANGAAAPTRVLSGGSTGLYQPTQLVVDSKGMLYVSNDFDGSGGNIVEFTPTQSGNVAPTRAITDNLHVFNGVAVDSAGTIYVLGGTLDRDTGFVTNAQIALYDNTQSGPADPRAVLRAGSTTLGTAAAIQIDAKDNLYVNQKSTATVPTEQLLVFGPNVANGTAPALTINGSTGAAKFLAFAIR